MKVVPTCFVSMDNRSPLSLPAVILNHSSEVEFAVEGGFSENILDRLAQSGALEEVLSEEELDFIPPLARILNNENVSEEVLNIGDGLVAAVAAKNLKGKKANPNLRVLGGGDLVRPDIVNRVLLEGFREVLVVGEVGVNFENPVELSMINFTQVSMDGGDNWSQLVVPTNIGEKGTSAEAVCHEEVVDILDVMGAEFNVPLAAVLDAIKKNITDVRATVVVATLDVVSKVEKAKLRKGLMSGSKPTRMSARVAVREVLCKVDAAFC
ncbi:hypothetical protein AMTR_s00048p00117830 [Amborella trichopoda]|uniref:Uncharacterized protein n=1 Tax=Amborella trichopoda TaxID=13333 RepID=U5CQT8_AMBTC|nr:hypothetical protein AMTR_s00048p00117830 [Amborella trichopoda]